MVQFSKVMIVAASGILLFSSCCTADDVQHNRIAGIMADIDLYDGGTYTIDSDIDGITERETPSTVSWV